MLGFPRYVPLFDCLDFHHNTVTQTVTFSDINPFTWDVFGGTERRSFSTFLEFPPPFIFSLRLVCIPSGKTSVSCSSLESFQSPYWQQFTEVSLAKCIQADPILPLMPWTQRGQVSELRAHISGLLLTSSHNSARCFSLRLYHYCQTQLLLQTGVFGPDFRIAQSSAD